MSISVLLVGCGFGAATVKPTERYDSASAYIYGRFQLKPEEGHRSPGGSMGFQIRCRDGSTYTVRMAERGSLQMIKIAPSVCQIDQFVYGGSSDALSQPATFRLFRNEFLDPGGVYYVGDFVAVSSSSSPLYPLFLGSTELHWALRSIQDNYEATTAAMKSKFPAFEDAKTENRMERVR